MFHKLLIRQLKKNNLNENTLPNEEQWKNLLKSISRSYQDADQERYLLERSLMISSDEMQAVYEQLQASETRYVLAAQGANDGLWDWNLLNEDVYYSQRWAEILGMMPEPGKVPCKDCWLERIHPDDHYRVVSELEAHIAGKTQHFHNEHRVLHSDGKYRWVLIRGLAVRDENEKAYRIAGSLTDITERKTAEEKLAHDAVHDALTSLPNRKLLMARIQKSLQRKQKDAKYGFAVLFIDLDRFKIINDSMGHQAGDELLLRITKRLQNIVRPMDMLARLGGDEFIILLENVKDQEQVTTISGRVLAKLQEPIRVENQEIYTSASIGVALASAEYDSPDDMVRDADLAMYRAKVKGKGRTEIFDTKMHAGAVSLLQTEIDLRSGIERKEFILHYQPIVSLDSDEIIGFESLVRWKHPTKGMIPPNDFIPIAEETGLILPLGKWVLWESCRQMQEWQSLYPWAENMIISVNLSARQLEKLDLIEEVAEALEATQFNPNNLKLEITESVIMGNAEQAEVTVKKLCEMGVRVSIDDFGTGYSSLSYLHRFPIDTLKVDRSFINRIGCEKENAEIVQTIVTLACNLGMEVVAEGVETKEQLDFLKQVHCRYGQGYFYSRPLSNDMATEMIQNLEGKFEMPLNATTIEITQIDNFLH